MKVPPSKSHTLRALIFALMAKGKSTIWNPLHSPDTEAMLNILRNYGAKVKIYPNSLEIYGTGPILPAADDVLQVGNSGIMLRFLSALAALSSHTTVITGDHSIRHKRPMKTLFRALEELGATIQPIREKGFAPAIIKGPLKPGTVTLDGKDSQPISALLIAASFAKGATTINVMNPGEAPWIDLTLHWLDLLGLPYHREGYTHFEIPGGATLAGFDYTVPADFSTLSYPLAAALLQGKPLTLTGINMDDPQGDKQVIEILKEMGAEIEIDGDKLTLRPSPHLKGIEIDINTCIDALPLLAVVGCYAKGTTRIHNGAIAREKECDRIAAITEELRKMGAIIEEKDDGLDITHSPMRGAHLSSHNDHRMALSLAVAAVGAKGESTIEEIACTEKTYPTFLEDFKTIGAEIEELI